MARPEVMMARILYAVQAEGMGHAIRSKVVIQHLSRKHDVIVVSSGRAYEFLKKNFPKVYDIHSYHLVYRKNSVSRLRTLLLNVRAAPKGVPKTIYRLFRLLSKWKPDLIFTDFEPFSDLLSKIFRIPVIAVDNVNVVVQADVEWEKKEIINYLLARLVARSFVIGARKYILTTFFYPTIKRPDKTVFVPPALRPEVLRKRPTVGKHLLVYQTSQSNEALFRLLEMSGQPCIVYGMGQRPSKGKVLYKGFDEKGFINDIASSKGVIINGGFTVLSEAIYFRKPILSVPVKGQFEQVLNAYYVEKLGYGMHVDTVTEYDLARFIKDLPRFRKKLRWYRQSGNKVLFREIDKAIGQVLRNDQNLVMQYINDVQQGVRSKFGRSKVR